ncbi:dihydroorotase [Patescibacteria group bacterium]|nr:dihydroorotase [Patescibacteria group bacterium]MBU1015881.1 dihydroorotase [Patescibacteria group bacterium]MBU1684750.1 dihydroorotase [Patescibacteria group bacterium]MBU1938884.1 dihydroorotase [Patescibacteria group bacterium]
MSKILIKGGRVMDPESGLDAVSDVLVEDQDIKEIGRIGPEKDMRVVDATGLIVIPGVIDLHVHLRDMEQAEKETIETGTKAARKGGVTTVYTMPNTKPPLSSAAAIKKYRELLKNARVEVGIIGAITKDLAGRELADFAGYAEPGIKFISDDGFDVNDEALLEQAYKKAMENDLILVTHPEMDSIGAGGVLNEGEVSRKLGVPGQPNEKEYKAVERGIRLAMKTGARAHFTHISTRESVDLVREAKKTSDLISCDATPHHFSLTEAEALRVGTLAKVNPPLRTEADRMAIIIGLKDGTIDFIVTDHAPHTEADKSDDFLKAAFGISQLETSLAASITELHFNQGMALMDVIRLMTLTPSRFAKLRVGRLKAGYPADITLVDLETEKTVDRMSFVSKGKNTPFHGKKLKGWPVKTIVRGAVY